MISVYISDGEARYPSDSYELSEVENSKNFKAICNFFDRFEKYYNLKVVIASHQDQHHKIFMIKI